MAAAATADDFNDASGLNLPKISAPDWAKKGLKFAFKAAAFSVPMFVLGGMMDLAFWHDMVGGQQVYTIMKEHILSFYESIGVNDAMKWLAKKLGYSIAKEAAKNGMGVASDPVTGEDVMVPDLGLDF